jgi:hypothetical protein
MKYRSNYMNEETWPNKIRNLTKDQLIFSLKNAKYMSDTLANLGIPKQSFLSKIILKKFIENDIDISHFPQGRRRNLKGMKFGHLLVLDVGPTLKCGNTTWICREEETGIEKPVLSKHLIKGTTKSFSFAASKGKDHHQWTGFGKISGNYWNTLKRHALSRKFEFSISIEYAWELYIKQNMKCALSGFDIYFGETNNCPYTASLDRIDSLKGYTESNIQWVHGKVNIMKNKFPQDEFINFCKAITDNQNIKQPT